MKIHDSCEDSTYLSARPRDGVVRVFQRRDLLLQLHQQWPKLFEGHTRDGRMLCLTTRQALEDHMTSGIGMETQ